jgi:ADP-ribosylglycohydrolase
MFSRTPPENQRLSHREGPADRQTTVDNEEVSGIRLSEAERALLATWRESRNRFPDLTAEERRLLDKWREWRAAPATRPLWAARLQHRLQDDQSTGDADPPTRFLGMLLGGAVGEAMSGGSGERTSALLFVLEGLIRAHTGARTSGSGDPQRCALGGLQRWAHTRGLPWPDCVATRSQADQHTPSAPDGWLVEQDALRATRSDDPTMLTALARVAAGQPHGTRQQPINAADSAIAVPLGALAALWSDDPKSVFHLGSDLAALTHGHSHGHHPAGLLAVTVFWLLHGGALWDAFGKALPNWELSGTEGASLSQAARLGRNRPPGFLPGRTQLDAMGAGRSGVQALSVALRVALACGSDFRSAIRIAADHGGDTGTSATLTGQLLGALHGPTVIPADWLEELAVRHLVEALAEDAATEFGPHPDESDQWGQRYPVLDPVEPLPEPVATAGYRTGLPRPASSRETFLGAVLGCAVGEALGTPVAGQTWEEIQSRHGELRDYIPAGYPAGRLGSDTQLLLFSLEGTIRANISRRRTGTDDPSRHIQHAYQRWLHTQHLSWPRAAGEFLDRTPEPDGWLVGHRALFQTRNPGRTMMRTLIAFAKGQQTMGTPDNPASASKGSSAVMRAVPVALWSSEPDEVFRIGMNTAALTHGDPVAYLSAGALAFLISRLLHGEPLTTAADDVLDVLREHSGHDDVSRHISTAIRLARSGRATPVHLERKIGTGWTAADALGIGLYAALVSESDFDIALPIAVNHSGNSATTGAVCGSLVGAALGADRIPERWLTDLELCEVIERLAHDAALEFGPRPPRQPDWFERYPPT